MQLPDYIFDKARLSALEAYSILDTPAEEGFDDIVNLAVYICETSVALVSFVAGDRQWFKARVGFETCETGLNGSVCAYALDQPDLLVIPDLTADSRTKNNIFVMGEPHIRFYAGAPLRTKDGDVLGTLCVIDGMPRPQGLSTKQADCLRNLARQVISQMELRRALAQRDAFIVESDHAEARRNGLIELGDRLRSLNTVPEMTVAASAIVGKVLGLIRVGFGRLDSTGEFIDVEPDWTASGVASMSGRHNLSDYGELGDTLRNVVPLVIDDVLTDQRTASGTAEKMLSPMSIRSMANTPLRDRGKIATLYAHSDLERKWSSKDLTFLQNVGDRLAASVAKADAESLQKTLNLELSHRMKNTMALVMAISKQTLKAVPDQAPVRALMERLQALSVAHEALLKKSWTAANITDLVQNILATLEKIGRFTITGPSVVIGPRATLSLSLLLHELSTNALKYGALSVPEGRVAVTWQHDNDTFILKWRELNGPAVQAPTRNGFGSRLINMGLIGTGGVDLRYLASGFEAEFTASLSQLQEIPEK